MEFEKDETGRLLNKNLEEKLTVSSGDSEAKPLIFTFVPTVRRLPTHIQLTDTSKFLVKIPEEPSDKSPETVNRSNSNDYLTFHRGSQEERNQGTLTHPSEASGKSIQGRVLETNQPQGMQQSDLFKAEYVFIVDSEGEDEVTSRKGEQGPPGGTGNMAARPKSLAISSSLVSDVVRPKIRGTDLKSSSYSEVSHGMASQQKHGQLTSSPTTSEQLACKPPAFSFVSPTNQKTPPVPANLDGASVLEEFHTRRLDVSGALVEETATYFQTTAHSSPFSASKGASWTLPFPHSTQLPGSNLSSPSAADQNPGLAPEVLKKTTPLTANVLSPRESLKTTSPSPSSSASLKSNSASYIPVRIVMHSLSPSPKPLTSSFHGSSSTVCSQMSSSGNLSKSGVKSQVPSRLSLLTAILKSNPSHQRPVSPASCPTFSLNSLASSTLALDQKVKQTTLTPKKSLSSCSLRAQSPAQAEHQVSELAQQSFHLPFFTKSTPTSQVSSLSPTTPVNSSLVSMNVEKTPSPTSLKSGTMQTNASSFADLPPVPPSSSLSSSKNKQDGDLRGSENPRNTYTHPSTLASSALSSVSPPINHSTMPSSPEKCFHPSPALSNLIDRSKRTSYKPSGQGLNPSALSSPALSSAGCASLPSLGSSSVPPAALPTPALQLSPSTLHPNCGSGSLPSRMMKSESTKSNHPAPVSTPSLPISLTRTKELISPCALSLSTGPENKKPKQYKTKSSYKAFAAIPTNTLLLEQKALDEPAKTENVSKDSTLDLPVEFCYPAQLRQKTEELCATIDKVLQDSLSMHSSDSPSRSPQTLLGSETIKTSTTLPKAAGRETKYANLSSPSSTVSESQLTKPGVIRPVPVKSKILLKKEEEVYEPNPFSKYLEDNSDLFSEQLSHPMVAIPEHETLDSKEQ
ncbi:muscular LMNA-interacting protein isoform X13 [Callospermophilus lateralis]|uniref:muscular LMNA-interacting protein isoform X13 n=1 Tax=Callospermophilus lateralis TaxID=76772 RepID=UPI004053A97F